LRRPSDTACRIGLDRRDVCVILYGDATGFVLRKLAGAERIVCGGAPRFERCATAASSSREQPSAIAVRWSKGRASGDEVWPHQFSSLGAARATALCVLRVSEVQRSNFRSASKAKRPANLAGAWLSGDNTSEVKFTIKISN